MFNSEHFLGHLSLQYKIKLMKFHNAAVNGSATESFQNCNWGQIDSMVDNG